MLRKVLLEGSPLLRTKCPTLSLESIRELVATEPNGQTLSELLLDMHQTMVAENGMGLAANQIGCLFRLFILKDNSVRGYQEYLNPEVISQDELVTFNDEGCLSIPGPKAATKRFRKLRLKWQDMEGVEHEGDFEDLRAFAVQHEIDHLDGKLYVDQLSWLVKDAVMRKHKKFLREQRRRE
jgi:peptide deformylase